MRRTHRVGLALACATALALSACGSDDDDEDGGGGGQAASDGPIKLGYLTSLSGPAAASFGGIEEGANARLSAYAEEGRDCSDTEFEVVMGDDASSPQGALAGVQNLVQQEEVYAVLPSSSAFYGAGEWAGTQGSGTPFVGASFDGGPQWQNEDYRNLFTATGANDYEKVADTYGQYWSDLGGTKAAVVAFDTPSSSGAALAAVQGAESAGLDRGYVNVSVPFGST